MSKLNGHLDFQSFNKFEKLLLAFGRWSYLWALLVCQSSLRFAPESSPFWSVVDDIRNLHLNEVELAFMETLALTGKGKHGILPFSSIQYQGFSF